jgi:tRNA(His) guanylyltransferase
MQLVVFCGVQGSGKTSFYDSRGNIDPKDATSAARELKGMSVAAKNEMLFQRGINFNEVASWQKRGAGIFCESFEKAGTNPVTGQSTTAARRRPRVELELPMCDEYDEFIRQVLGDTPSANADLPGRGRT